jgi:hypothetical protein
MAVSSWAKVMCLVLAILWVPITTHCAVETLSGYALWVCCFETKDSPHQSNACQEDGCSVVESGHYRIEDDAGNIPVPVLLLSIALTRLTEAEFAPVISQPIPRLSPPELLCAWQFSSRAALPVRAPSIAS